MGTTTQRDEMTEHTIEAQQQAERLPPPLSGTLDLLGLFGVRPAYDEYVRPYLPPSLAGTSSSEGANGSLHGQGQQHQPATLEEAMEAFKRKAAQPAATSNSKGKQPMGSGTPTIAENGQQAATDAQQLQQPQPNGRQEQQPRKFERNFGQLVEDVAGRNLIKKDSHLRQLVTNPDAANSGPLHIRPFDSDTLRSALTLEPGPIQGFDLSMWSGGGIEVPQKQKRKKRKRGETSIDGLPGQAGASGDEHRRKRAR